MLSLGLTSIGLLELQPTPLIAKSASKNFLIPLTADGSIVNAVSSGKTLLPAVNATEAERITLKASQRRLRLSSVFSQDNSYLEKYVWPQEAGKTTLWTFERKL